MEEQKFSGKTGEVKLMILNPGHFHAGLVQKFMYDQIDPVVHVFAPEGPDVLNYLNQVEGFNTRKDNPTRWEESVYKGPDYLKKMIGGKPGNLVVLSGNNKKKISYISASIHAGLNVLADKPMIIVSDDFETLKADFETAREKGVLLYDIMTERFEITSLLQKALAHQPSMFGELVKGTVDEPAVVKESVHHFFKYVSGKPIKRPAWFFDVSQQGEGIVDVTTHLVDLIQWACFPEVTLDYRKDIEMVSAKRWATELTPRMFKKVTGLGSYPDYLNKDVKNDSVLQVYSNGEMNYTLKGVHAKVSVVWNFEAPKGAKDTHYSIIRGTKANLIIRQGKDQDYKPLLYVQKVSDEGDEAFENNLIQVISGLSETYPGIQAEKSGDEWIIRIPDRYKIGHEAHFAQVTKTYLKYLVEGMPDWEVPNMLAKYYTTTKAYEMSR
jgi:predicted dehydrogenase